MKTIHNSRLYDQYIQSRQIRQMFTGELPRFLLLHYAPGELLTNPFSPSGYLQLVVDGDLLLYDMPDESSTVSLQTAFHNVNILGDMELLGVPFTPLFVEAKTDVYTLALYLEQHRQRLLADPAFLRYLCVSMAEKLNGAAAGVLSAGVAAVSSRSAAERFTSISPSLLSRTDPAWYRPMTLLSSSI